MDLDEFTSACDAGAAEGGWPCAWPPLLLSLALVRAGDWEAAHSIVQDDSTAQGSAVHAYLHRKEGDRGNAEYWYRKARRVPFEGSLEKEWRALAQELLG